MEKKVKTRFLQIIMILFLITMLGCGALYTGETSIIKQGSTSKDAVKLGSIEFGDATYDTYPEAGSCFTLNIPLSLSGFVSLNNASFEYKIEAPFTLNSDTKIRTISTLHKDVTTWLIYNICVDSSANEGMYKQNFWLSQKTSNTAIIEKTFYLPVGGVPDFEIKMLPLKFNKSTEKVSLFLKNIGSGKAQDISMSINTDDLPLTLSGMSDFSISSLEKNEEKEFTLDVSVDTVAAFELPVTLTYKNNLNEQSTKTIDLGVIADETKKEPYISIRLDPTEMDEDTKKMKLTIVNTGRSGAKDIDITLTTTNTPLIIQDSNTFRISSLDAGKATVKNFNINIAQTSSFTLPATISYASELDEDETFSSSIVLGIGEIEKEDTETRVEVTDVIVTPELIFPGEKFFITFFVKNTGTDPIESVNVQIGETIAGGLESAKRNTEQIVTYEIESETFIPYKDSDTKFFKKLEPGEFKIVEYSMIASTEAVSGSYSVPVVVRFLDKDETEQEESKKIGLAVRSKPTLTLSDLSTVPTEIVPGTPFTLTIGVSNAGPDKARALKIRFYSNEDFKVMGSDMIFIGALEVDATDSAEFTVVAQKSGGRQALPIYYEFVDEYGNTLTKFANASLNIGGSVNTAAKNKKQFANLGNTITAGKGNTMQSDVKINLKTFSDTYDQSYTTIGIVTLLLLVTVYLIGKKLEPEGDKPATNIVETFFRFLVNYRVLFTLVLIIVFGVLFVQQKTSIDTQRAVQNIVITNAELRTELSKIPDVKNWDISTMEKGTLSKNAKDVNTALLDSYIVTLKAVENEEKDVRIEVDMRDSQKRITSADICIGGSCKILYEPEEKEVDWDTIRKKMRIQRGKGGSTATMRIK